MLFFSSDKAEVETVSQVFTQAGIPCEVRPGLAPHGRAENPRQAELWIRDDKDCHRALMLCVELGIGFSRRPARTEPIEELETVPAQEQD